MFYEYLPSEGSARPRRSEVMSDSEAEREIGHRVMSGFGASHRMFESSSGEFVSVVYFQSKFVGNVWSIYYD